MLNNGCCDVTEAEFSCLLDFLVAFLFRYMTFESVVTLAVISMERLWSVRWPIHYKQTNSLKNIAFLILGTWTGVSCVWMPGYFIDRLRPGNVAEDCAFDPAKNFTAGVCVGLLGYLIPYVFMMVCYVYVGWKMRKRLRGILPKALGGRSTATSYIQKATSFSAKETNGQQIFSISPTISQRENAACRLRAVDLDEENAEEMARKAKKAAAKVTLSRERSVLLTLGAIVLAFTICWIPFYLYFFVTLFQWAELPVWFATLTYWTAYLNSAMNPILYTALHRDFRNKFLQTLKAVFSKDVGVTTPKH
jgi:7 transmembrane receptor (rhodopsin family)